MVSLWMWVVFNVFILAMLLLDLFVFHKKTHQVSLKEATIWTCVWIILALLFNVLIYFGLGKVAAVNFLTGYLIEKTLSVDNLFVFILLFKYFHVQKKDQHRILFWGVFGAICARALFIYLGITLVEMFHPIIYIFGLFLVFTGIKFFFEKEKTIEPEKNFLIQFLQRHFSLSKFFVVLIAIETTDIIFAIDSIPAILAITYDPFIVYTSNIFAILGLRSLFFVVAGSLELFRFLHYGIALILVFVGLKMLFSDLFPISPLLSFLIIFAILLLSILLSIFKKK